MAIDAGAVVQFQHRDSTERIFTKELRRLAVAVEKVDLLERHRDTLFSQKDSNSPRIGSYFHFVDFHPTAS
jgi:hypothetical protein